MRPAATTPSPLSAPRPHVPSDEEPLGCGCLARLAGVDWLDPSHVPLAPLDDEEGLRVPAALPPVVDAHVHAFPDPVFDALWAWFERHAWPIRYKLRTPDLVAFQLARGVERVVTLIYAHKPGMARSLNRYAAALMQAEPRVRALGTVLPGEPDAVAIVEEAFALGLVGLKLHCHVQCFAPDAPELAPIFEACVRHDRPLVMHAGREPASQAYRCDARALCGAERVDAVLRDFPRLRLVVPHLGADEFDAYERLLERHDNLWLDTTMAVAGYFPIEVPWGLVERRPDRLLYGSDFPNLPYAWDRELARIGARRMREEDLAAVLGGNARALFG